MHLGQREVVKRARRFNVVCCGRRWGKTVLCEKLLLHPWNADNGALNGFPVAYCAPTYKTLMDVWRELTDLTQNITQKKSEEEHRLELITGGVIDFWSLDNPDGPRGRKYKRIIIDEAAHVPKIAYGWQKVIRPTLTDMKGDAWFVSTPQGKNNYFYELFTRHRERPDWISWQMPSAFNPFLPEGEVEEARLELDPISFSQEYLASFTQENLDSFAYCFDEKKHVAKTTLNPAHALYLSFDFNRNPITCGVFQHYDDHIYCIEQVKLPSSNIYQLCDYIRAKYEGYLLLITGDATGKASSALVKDNINYYTVIKAELHLSNTQLKVPSINPSLTENRVLVNSVLHHKSVSLDPDNCKGLIFDLTYARVLPDGTLDKTDRTDPTKQLDALDCFRYYLNTFHARTLRTHT